MSKKCIIVFSSVTKKIKKNRKHKEIQDSFSLLVLLAEDPLEDFEILHNVRYKCPCHTIVLINET